MCRQQPGVCTHNVKVGGVGRAGEPGGPGRAARLHVYDGGAQAVDVDLGVVTATQHHLWAHVHLEEVEEGWVGWSVLLKYLKEVKR